RTLPARRGRSVARRAGSAPRSSSARGRTRRHAAIRAGGGADVAGPSRGRARVRRPRRRARRRWTRSVARRTWPELTAVGGSAPGGAGLLSVAVADGLEGLRPIRRRIKDRILEPAYSLYERRLLR